jgi:hypothetical protein
MCSANISSPRHDPEQPGFLTLPVGGQFGRHLAQQVACMAQVAAVDRAHGLPSEVGGTLVFRDVVAQQRHLAAPAVVAHSFWTLPVLGTSAADVGTRK